MTRRPNQYVQEPYSFSFDHPSLTATTAYKADKAAFSWVIDSITYINPTGLAAHAADNFKCTITKTGAVSLISAVLFDTDADDGASLAADTHVAGAMSAVAGATTLAADDIITITLTEEGTATLPAGRFVFRGRRV